jgi:hypothetical protein
MPAMYASPPVGALTATAGSLPSARILAAVMRIGATLLPIDSQAASAAAPVARHIEGGEVSQKVPFVVMMCFGIVKRSKTGADEGSVKEGNLEGRRNTIERCCPPVVLVCYTICFGG